MHSLARLLLVAIVMPACHPATIPYVAAGPSTSLHFDAPDDGRAYAVAITDATSHRAACKLPCDAQVASGTSSFMVSRDDGQLVSGLAVVPPAPSVATIHHKRRGQAIAGAVISIAGLILTVPVTFDAAAGTGNSTDLTLGAVGIGALIVGTIVMLTAGTDGVDVR
jgi:hypothetical protein